ncbi:MAG TPA: hypothetical protein VK209_05215, partial [Candidatus Sulfotelmatobacter sp.]|nr:hypothetical protein [Candidatus Sulfotelmatobacter sp.]
PYLVYGNVNDNYPLINTPKFPERITPIPWVTSFFIQSTSSQETPNQENKDTTSSNSPSDNQNNNTTNSIPSDKNSGLSLSSEIIITAVAVMIIGLVVVAIAFYVRKHKRRVETT